MKKKELIIFVVLVALMVVFRVTAHAANGTPFLALAIFAGVLLKNRSLAMAAPVLALFFSDLSLELYPGWAFVYLPMAVMGFVGASIAPKLTPWIGSAVGGSLFFFAISNLGVWWSSGLYSQDFSGLLECYMLALPFLYRTFFHTLLASALFYGIYRSLKHLGWAGISEIRSHG